MQEQTINQTLQLDQILATVADYTHSQVAAQQLQRPTVQRGLTAVQHQLTLTHEAHQLLAANVTLTFFDLDQLTVIKTKLDQGHLLTVAQLQVVLAALVSWQRLVTVLTQHAQLAPTLSRYVQPQPGINGMRRRLEQMLNEHGLRDDATPELADLRQRKQKLAQKIQAGVNQFIQKHPHELQSRQVSQRDQHYVVQLKANYKHRFTGSLLGQSSTGSTVYFEPGTVTKLGSQFAQVVGEEEAEVYQIVATLTGDVAEHWPELQQRAQALSELDQIFARGQYGLDQAAIQPQLNDEQRIKIVAGRHPLLGDQAVLLDVALAPTESLMITGANSGGKTVVLKTIALFSLMIKVGLEVPAESGTTLAVFDQILIDIGDQQNLAAQLSTFSGEMTTLVQITDQLRPNALVLMDEIGSGTDPEEGAALGIAIIDDLIQRHAKLIVTTHYSEIKRYAVAEPQFVTAAMAFNRETLRPEYRLLLHQVGESEAMWLAARLGLKPSILEKARARLGD